MDKVLKRLGYKAGDRSLVTRAPEELQEALTKPMQPAPDAQIRGAYAFLMVFVKSMAEFTVIKNSLAEATAPQGRLWVCYPKKSSKKHRSDLSRDLLWPQMGGLGFEPVSQYAVDEDWSAIRFRPVREIKKMVRLAAATQEGRERAEQERAKRAEK